MVGPTPDDSKVTTSRVDPLQTRVGWVVGLYRYPVKSVGGEQVLRLDAGESLRGDRAFGIIDASTGKLLSAKTVPRLLAASAKFRDDGEVTISLPLVDGFGTAISSDEPSCDADLSDWLHQHVHLVRPTGGERRTIDIEIERSYYEPNASGTEVVNFDSPIGMFTDSSPVHVLTTNSLLAAAAVYPEGSWTIDRFRPNVVIEAKGQGWVEDAWVGKRLDVGGAELQITKPCERCVVVTRSFGEAVADKHILRTLHAQHDMNLGVKAEIDGVGVIAMGDSVFLPC